MGLTNKSTGNAVIKSDCTVARQPNRKTIALAGNPNVGKSTVFNSLTGLNQHTGNWPGKTVANAEGVYTYKGREYVLVDIPGTYSLMANSVEEEIARDFVCFGNPDVTVVVADATCLERNLNLVLQTLEITDQVVLCVNLMDEAKKKHISIDLDMLSKQLGIPVVGAAARSGKGLKALMEAVSREVWQEEKRTVARPIYQPAVEDAISIVQDRVSVLARGKIDARWLSVKLLDPDEKLLDSVREYLGEDISKDGILKVQLQKVTAKLEEEGITPEGLRDLMVADIVKMAEKIYGECVEVQSERYHALDRKLDKILTSKHTGIPIMILLLGIIFWITIEGANYPSALLSDGLFWIEGQLLTLFETIGAPAWLTGALISGIYRTLAWVVSVMLPPMAIFFPLFTLLEDSGYLPRIAFNLDKYFKKACAHGKQALTMCMGFGCNACGVIGCRIIDSPRERLIAILTNNFVPCNGRFPTLIAIITMFFAGGLVGGFESVVSTLLLLTVIMLGVFMTLGMSKLLSKTILKGMPSSFVLELPPYRKPQIGKVIVRSVLDRTLFVLGRAVVVAIPAGLLIWVMANVSVEGVSILQHCTQFLDPFARLFGLDGVILMAFILGFPANEIVVPIIIMSYMATGSLMEFSSLEALRMLLVDNGWTWLTAVCTMLFVLMHFPCGTTCMTIKKETGSAKWTAISILLPTITGLVICFIVANVARLLGAV